jgi:hypothetical protein
MLLKEIEENIAESLESKTLGRCSRWTERVRIMGDGKNWSFLLHPWLKTLHDDQCSEIVIMKGAQLGFTEYALNRTLFTLDQLKQNVLYALPSTRPDAVNFSRSRLNAAAKLSPYIDNLFSVGDNEMQKITKDYRTLYIRGSNSRGGFKSVDVGLVVLDECDEYSQESVGLARQRTRGQMTAYQLIMLSTPHLPGQGVDLYYQETDQRHYKFPCPHCSRWIEFRYPESIVITAESLTDKSINDSYLQCTKCKHKLSHEEKYIYLNNGKWIPEYPDRPLHGYAINQLYSSAHGANPVELARQEIRGRYNVAEKIEFYNSTLGLTYVAEGAQLTEEHINECIKMKDYNNGDRKQSRDHVITIGIDVGQEKHHVSVVAWQFDPSLSRTDITISSVGKLLYYGTVNSFEEANDLIKHWQPRFIVVDAQPEAREAVSLCKRWRGICFTCYYSLKKVSREIERGNKSEFSLSVNRTYWLDVALGKVRNKMMALPNDLSFEYRSHLKALTKTYTTDADGNLVSMYAKKENDADHYAHALTYATIAMALMAGTGDNQDTSE